MGSSSPVLLSPSPSPAAAATEVASDHDGPFSWWMPGASTAAKVGVFASILVALVLVALAMRLVLRRWRQQREADDPEMLGTTALKELFFSRTAPSSSYIKGAGSGNFPSPTAHSNLAHGPYSDGNVWLKGEGRRQHRTHLLTEANKPGTAEKMSSAGPVSAGTVQLVASDITGNSPNPLRESGSLSQADSTVALLVHPKEPANHDKDETSSSTPSPAIHAALTVGHRRAGSSISPLQSEHMDGPAAGLSPMPSEETGSPAGMPPAGSGSEGAQGGPVPAHAGLEMLPCPPPHHVVAMQQVMGLMCPGEPAIEQRLQAVLQEALHGQSVGSGPGSQGHMLAPTLSSSSTGGVAAMATGVSPMQTTPTLSSGGLGMSSGSGGVNASSLPHAANSGGPGSGTGGTPMAGHAGLYGTWRGSRPLMAREILTGMLSPRDFMVAQQQQQQLAHRASMPVPEHVLQYAIPSGPPSQGRVPHARTHTWTEVNSMQRQEHGMSAVQPSPPVLAGQVAGEALSTGQRAESSTAAQPQLPRPPQQSVFSSVPAQAVTSAALEACPQPQNTRLMAAVGPPSGSAAGRSVSHASALDKALSRMAAAPLPRPRSVMAVDKAAAALATRHTAGVAPTPADTSVMLQAHASDAYKEHVQQVSDVAQQQSQDSNGVGVHSQHPTQQHQVTIGGAITGGEEPPQQQASVTGVTQQPQLQAVRVASMEQWAARGSPVGSRVASPTVAASSGKAAVSPFHPSRAIASTPNIDPLDDSPFNDTSHQLAQLSHFQAYIQGADLPATKQVGLGPVRLVSYDPLPNADSPGPSHITPSDSVTRQAVRNSSGGLSSQFSFVYQPRPSVSPVAASSSLPLQMINNEAAEQSEHSTMSPQYSVKGMLDMQGAPLGQPAASPGQ